MSQTASLSVGTDGSTRPTPWPADFQRIPDEDWTRQPTDDFGRQYDAVGNHSWYKNLEPIVAQVLATLDDDDILMDYSSGTGILAGRILPHVGRRIGILNVDASPKFLRVAIDNFEHDERVAYRLLRFLREERRLQRLDEILPDSIQQRGVDVVTSTNAIHLYYNLDETLEQWHRTMRPGALALVCSGNLRNPQRRPDEWIIDDTVASINEVAGEIVRTDPYYAAYRDSLDDADRMEAYRKLREKVFVPVRPLDLYTDAFARAGFTVQHVHDTTIHARIDEWYELLRTYNEGVLGWLGGSQKVDGKAPTDIAVEHRLQLIRQSLQQLFPGQDSFPCSWTYITCRR